MSDAVHTFERFVVAGVHTETGETHVATEDDYLDIDGAPLLLVALSKRDAAAAFADMSADDNFSQVTVHRLVLSPALDLEQINALFEEV